jgi:hypothetical protein
LTTPNQLVTIIGEGGFSMKGQDYEPTLLEKVLAQWPGVAGLILIAAALGYVWYAKTYPPHILYFRPVIVTIALGIVLIGYWTFASNSKSNY